MKEKGMVFLLPLRICLLAILIVGLLSFIGCGDGDGGGSSTIGAGNVQAIKITEVMFIPSTGAEWVELYNSSNDQMIDLSLAEIHNIKGDVFQIPFGTPEIPPGGYALILFGEETTSINSSNVDDNCTVLRIATPSDNVFDDSSDSCTFYSPDGSAIDFVAWGDYGHSGHYVSNIETYGGDGPVNEGESIGIHPDEYQKSRPTAWVIYLPSQISQGEKNPVPAPKPIVPFDGTNLADAQVSFAWTDWYINTQDFYLEVDDDAYFRSPDISVLADGTPYHATTELPSGTYHWRLRSRTKSLEESPWSNVYTFTIASPTQSRLVKENDLNMEAMLQRKDTSWLCPGCSKDDTKHPWDKPHAFEKKSQCQHCKHYCGRACVAMVNKKFNGELSQDRISFWMFASQLDPAAQLGHGKGFNGFNVRDSLKLALAGAPECPLKAYSFDAVVKYIDQGCPIIGAIEKEPGQNNGHVVVIDGYEDFEDPAEDRIHVLQPYTGEQERVKNTETQIDQMWIIPENSQGIKEEDPEQNSDTDELKDFEEKRIYNTDPSKPDTDGDGLSDYIEVYAWVWGKGVKARRPINGWNIWNKPNYDDDPYKDGEEDFNKNGNVDPGECDPFVAEKPLKVTLEVAGADGGSPTAELNSQQSRPIGSTGSSAGYFSKEVSFLWCGVLEVGTNSITITALKSGSNDLYDDIQIRNIKILDQDNNKTLLEVAGPFHLGDNTVASIYEEWEEGQWHDPNPPSFWAALDGVRIIIKFDWTGYQFE